MSETPKCPMGHEMELIDVATGGWRYACKKCATSYKADKKAASGWLSPIRSRKDLAYDAAMMLAAEPENHPLTLEEAQEKSKNGDAVWLEETGGPSAPIAAHITPIDPLSACCYVYTFFSTFPMRRSTYGKTWRCWPRKPTPEQMQAEKWEE